MAKKVKTFMCIACGEPHSKWSGRCLTCGEWDTIAEAEQNRGPLGGVEQRQDRSALLADIELDEDKERWKTGVVEFDRVMGGGISQYSLGLLGGEPGVGKSTLILQLLSRLARSGKRALYVSGEESATQIKERALRLEIDAADIRVLIETNLEEAIASITKVQPDFIVIDSIQTLFSNALPGIPGSVSQVRETTTQLIRLSKQNGPTVLIIGHVTKEGNLAGPKTLEHMVDYVLYLERLEGDYRVLRSVKNRFGSLREVGFFVMTAKGLAQIRDPNKRFMESRKTMLSGSTIFPMLEGERLMLVEIQSLVGVYEQNIASRTSSGVDRNRLALLLAVAEKYLDVKYNGLDVYVNLAGGYKVNDPAIDLALLAALLSGIKNVPLPSETVFFGEVSLTGTFSAHLEWKGRLEHLNRYGFTRAIMPSIPKYKQAFEYAGLEVQTVSSVVELFECILPESA